MREMCFENMKVKAHGGTNKPNIPDYEPNITKMRILRLVSQVVLRLKF